MRTSLIFSFCDVSAVTLKSITKLTFLFLLTLSFLVRSRAASVAYTYDYLDRLTKLDYGNGSVISYTYDRAGNRLTYSAVAPGDTNSPVIAVTSPTSDSSFSTNIATVNLSGSASDNIGVTLVTWANDRGGIGTASGTTNWIISGVHLQKGANVITVTTWDSAGNNTPITLTVTYNPPSTLTVTGITAANKVYDGTTSATINATNATLNGVLPGDVGNVTLVTADATGTFADKNVGTGKVVTVAGLALSGSAAINYTLTQPTTTADIMHLSEITLTNPGLVGQVFNVSVSTVPGANYSLEYRNSFTDPDWVVGQTMLGSGGVITLTDKTVTGSARFYRVRVY